jgi:hypothetical protein
LKEKKYEFHDAEKTIKIIPDRKAGDRAAPTLGDMPQRSAYRI